RVLQFLGGAERDLLARLDLDRFAGRGIASHAGGALADLKDAESVETDANALLELLGDEDDEVVHDRIGLLLGEAMLRRHLDRDLTVADGLGLRLGSLRRSRHFCHWIPLLDCWVERKHA